MDIDQEKSGRVLILKPLGRIDGSADTVLEQELRDRITKSTTAILLDFSTVDYINSAGLRVILIGARQAQASGGKLALCSFVPHVQKVFDVSGFSKILQIYPSRTEALAELS